MTEIIQGTEAWKQIRLGKVTASRVADVIARTKSGWGASRANYMAELIAERLTGEAAAGFTNDAMRWGTEKEPEARAAYAFCSDIDVVEIGFVEHPTIPMTGASPDGLCGADGLVEFKCPNTATHLETLLGQAVPAKYIAQMQWQMACTGRVWCDWVSYDPRLPESMRLFVQRVPRDNAMIAELERHVIDFLAEIDVKVHALNERYTRKAAAQSLRAMDKKEFQASKQAVLDLLAKLLGVEPAALSSQSSPPLSPSHQRQRERATA